LIAVVVGSVVDAFKKKSKPFVISGVLMFISTILCFVGTHPATFIASRVVQGISVTFTWVTGLALLSVQIGERELCTYFGWTTVGVAVGEIIGPLIGGPIYDYAGHWATFGAI
jgi:MFS family permease